MQLVAVALISAGVLAYEILLARLFAIVQWYHFAYMIISMALLGYGASGTLPGARPGPPAGAPERRLRALRDGLRDRRDRLLRARRAAAVQRAGGDLGPAPAALPARPLCAADGAVLLWRDLRRPGASPLSPSRSGGSIAPICWAPGSARSASSACSSWCCRRARCGSSARSARSRRRWSASPIRTGAPGGGRRPSPAWPCSVGLATPASWTALQLSPYKSLSQALQGAGRRDRRGALEPARPAQRRREPEGPVSPRPGPQPQQHPGAGGADRRVHRRRGAEPDHRVRRRPRAARAISTSRSGRCLIICSSGRRS